MDFLFGSKKKSGADLVKTCQTHLQNLSGITDDEKVPQKTSDKLTESLAAMKFMLYGDSETDPRKEDVDKLVDLLFSTNLLVGLLDAMPKLEFEARKDVAQIFNYVLRQRKSTAIDYVQSHQDILRKLVGGYKDHSIALNCGSILRECIRNSALAEMVLKDHALFDPFFEYVQLSTFDVASDAFATFKTLLTRHKALCAGFLEKNFDDVFSKYNQLLTSKNYVTKRQSLKLLGELLLDRSNFKIMMRYINDPKNLKTMMTLLSGTTKAIQFEAFHVFKIFVANPQKSDPVAEILLRNKDRLIKFLKKFHTDKDDEQFAEEKRILLNALDKLKPKE